LILTPLVRTWSRRHGFIDRPGMRHVHTSPTPRTGGIAIVVAYAVPVGVLTVLPLNAADSINLPEVVKLLPAALIVFSIGLLDDLIGLAPWEKLLGQGVAACLAFGAGVDVSKVAGYTVPTFLSLPLTVGWLLACTNAFNLIDGVDGLAAGVGLFAATTTLMAALLQSNAPLALATAPLVGALLAFLRYNFNPASIFLGDCGSLTIGFVLGCFGAVWSQKSATLLGMTAPLVALAVPLVDTSVAIARRFLRRQPIFSADSNHIHHRLLARGLTPRQVALVLYSVCGMAAAFSLLVTVPGNRFAGLVLVAFCIAVWVGVHRVGYVEFDAAQKLVTTASFRRVLDERLFVSSIEERCSKPVTADDYWTIVREVARRFRCTHVRMSLLGSLYEARHEPTQACSSCIVRIPLSAGDYVNFQYPVALDTDRAKAIASIVEILQGTITLDRPTSAVGGPGRGIAHIAAKVTSFPDFEAAIAGLSETGK
jgi:UDP-GlcNAc:undecaprenyl-phosphate GlcNAc-1-phosphate transferase